MNRISDRHYCDIVTFLSSLRREKSSESGPVYWKEGRFWKRPPLLAGGSLLQRSDSETSAVPPYVCADRGEWRG